MEIFSWPDPRRARVVLICTGPFAGSVGLGAGTVVALASQSPSVLGHAIQVAVQCYGIGLAVSLFMEGEYWSETPYSYRILEIAVGAISLMFSGALFSGLFVPASWGSLRLALFLAVLGATTCLPRRKDTVRAITFSVLAIVTLLRPLFQMKPPFVSLSVLLALAAIYYATRVKWQNLPSLRWSGLPRALASTFLAGVSLYMSIIAYRASHPFPWWIFLVPFIFFAVNTVFLLLRGRPI